VTFRGLWRTPGQAKVSISLNTVINFEKTTFPKKTTKHAQKGHLVEPLLVPFFAKNTFPKKAMKNGSKSAPF